MKKHNYFQEMMVVYERLLDEESKKVFEARIAYMLEQNKDNYIESIADIYQDWQILEISERRKENQRIILFGAGHDGRLAYRLLMSGGVKAAYYCDNFQCGEIIDGIKVLSADEVLKEHREDFVIIASSKYGQSMYIQLVQGGFPCQNILLPKYKEVLAIRGKQYFDVFEPQPDEIYIDAGAYDGGTILDFCEWAKGNYKKIYAFEPVKDMCKHISEKIDKAGLKNVQILNNAVWGCKATLNFSDVGPGSEVSGDGAQIVQGVDIDSVLKQERVTFIKMDIEGSERKALEGARKTIIANNPRLAVCIYHKPMDVIEIAAYLLELVPEYKFYIRHYCSNMWETVLYAYVPQ